MALFETKKAIDESIAGKEEEVAAQKLADPTKRMGEVRKTQEQATEPLFAGAQAQHARVDQLVAQGSLSEAEGRAEHAEIDKGTTGAVGKVGSDVAAIEEDVAQKEITNMTNQIDEGYRFQRQTAQADAQLIGNYLKTLMELSGASAKVAGQIITGVPTG